MQVLTGVTSGNELAVIQAKQGNVWEPSTEAELDHMEAEGIQQPVIQPHVVALDPPLAEGAIVRCPHCYASACTIVKHAAWQHLLQL